MTPGELFVMAPQDVAHLAGVGEQVIGFHHVDRRDRGRDAERVGVVREASPEDAIVEPFGHLRTHADRPEREVTGGQTLRGGDEIGNHLPVIDGEPLAGAPEPAFGPLPSRRLCPKVVDCQRFGVGA